MDFLYFCDFFVENRILVSLYTLSVFGRGAVLNLFEYAAEIVLICDTDFRTNLCDGEVCSHQKLASVSDAYFKKIAVRRDARPFLEEMGEAAFAETAFCRIVRDGALTAVVAVHLSADAFNTGVLLCGDAHAFVLQFSSDEGEQLLQVPCTKLLVHRFREVEVINQLSKECF